MADEAGRTWQVIVTGCTAGAWADGITNSTRQAVDVLRAIRGFLAATIVQIAGLGAGAICVTLTPLPTSAFDANPVTYAVDIVGAVLRILAFVGCLITGLVALASDCRTAGYASLIDAGIITFTVVNRITVTGCFTLICGRIAALPARAIVASWNALGLIGARARRRITAPAIGTGVIFVTGGRLDALTGRIDT